MHALAQISDEWVGPQRWWASAGRWCAIIGLLMGLLSLSGCNAVRLGYNNAPDLAYWWLDGYFDFDGAQSTRLRNDLYALQDWHRKEELPPLATTLKNLQAAAPQEVTAAQVCQLSQYVEERIQATLDRAAPTAVALGPTLSAAQLEHLARALDKRNREWREEWMDGSPEDRAERRLKKLVERAEGFYGRITEAQRKQLQAQLEASAFDASLQYREVLRRQQDTLQTLRALRTGNPTEIHTQAEVRALVARSLQSPDPAFRQYTDRVRSQACEAIAAFHNRTSISQRQRLQETLKGYEGDVLALMRP
ncbi:hypothetical protein CHU94_04720 [Rhodoferax sp. TH121]|uniref:DUF6279 family lipoprotein n=1 Tax=Rhodoferax sp. TH121 TaxID=2022803 RepID=UPI000B96FCBC|nr:DUF6279 family lipoprotein [Rhodoferax sp. TH121]OYQ41684.1 hypothetical protein CHU94_04720 [Rhodoferax sp. TH121]